jgi:serine/threonine protein kinase
MSCSRKGTIGYMPPEVENFSLDISFDMFKVDIYSLGVTLKKLLGKSVF